VSPTVFFSVGEPSGDLHAAKLIESLRQASNGLTALGLGGPHMQRTGCEVIYPLTDLAVVGFVEVIPKLREFFRVADLASDSLDRHHPDAVVLVDFPGFNWHIAKRAKSRGIPVFYYLPPQLWAWGGWRIHKMRRYVDHVLCNLPFEQRWFEERGMKAYHVGHPFFDEVQQRQLDQQFIAAATDAQVVNVAVLPGSRSREVRTIWPMQLETIRQLSRKHRTARFHVACLKPEHLQFCQQTLSDLDKSIALNFAVGKTSEIIQLADCALTKSGSVSLELMARGVPSVVVYHLGRISYQVVRRLTNLSSITLPNILAREKVMEEFLAVGSTDQAIRSSTQALDLLISNPEARALQRSKLNQLAELYAKPGASQTAAELILALLSAPSATSRLRAA
jgi:lipid-A-disaccharide synthase